MKWFYCFILLAVSLLCSAFNFNGSRELNGEWLKIASQDDYDLFEIQQLAGHEHVYNEPSLYVFSTNTLTSFDKNGKENKFEVEFTDNNTNLKFKDSFKKYKITWLSDNDTIHIQEFGTFIKKRKFKNRIEYKLAVLAANTETVLRDLFFSLKLTDFQYDFKEHNIKFNKDDNDLLNFDDVSIVHLNEERLGKIAGYMLFRIHDVIKGIHTNHKNYVLQNYTALKAAQVEEIDAKNAIIKLPHPEYGACYIPIILKDDYREEYLLLQPCRSRESVQRQFAAYQAFQKSVEEMEKFKADKERMKRVVLANMLKGIRIHNSKVSRDLNGSVTFSVTNESAIHIASIDMAFVIFDHSGSVVYKGSFVANTDLPPGETKSVQQPVKNISISSSYSSRPPQPYDSKFPEYLAQKVADGQFTFQLLLQNFAESGSAQSGQKQKMYLPTIDDNKLQLKDGKWFYDSQLIDESTEPLQYLSGFYYDANSAKQLYEKFVETEKSLALNSASDIECTASLGMGVNNFYSLFVIFTNISDNDMKILEIQVVQQGQSGHYTVLHTINTQINIEALTTINKSFTLNNIDKKAKSYFDAFGDKDIKVRISKLETL